MSLRGGLTLSTLLILLPISVFGERKIELDAYGVPLAAPDAAVDRVAYAYTKKAILKLERLLKRKQYQSQKSDFLFRLSKLTHQQGDIAFRIAHAEAYFSKKPIDLKHYRSVMKNSIRFLNQLVENDPNSGKRVQIRLMRAHAFEESGERSSAVRDYEYIVEKYESSEEVKTAYLALADFAVESGRHRRAIGFFGKILEDKKNTAHSYALYKSAWSYYHLGEIDRALAYLVDYIQFANRREGKQKILADSNKLLREQVLVESTLFYLKGFEAKLPKYRINRAIPFFKAMASSVKGEEAFGKMLIRFAKLLRAHNHPQELNEFKDAVLDQEWRASASLEVATIAYEDQLNKLQYRSLKKTANQIRDLSKRARRFYSFDHAKKALMESADQIQTFISTTNNLGRKKGLTSVLNSIYESLIGVLDREDPRNFRIHYNLGEAFSRVEKIDRAIKHYAWVAEAARRNPEAARSSGVDSIRARLKTIELRYQDLKKKKLISKVVQLKKLDENQPQKFPLRMQQWVRWVGELQETSRKKRLKENLDDLQFYTHESIRAIYNLGHVEKAVEELISFSLSNPESKYAIPSAKLAIDTLVASRVWEKVFLLASRFEKEKWKEANFRKKMANLAADSYYKLAESRFNKGEFKEVMAQAKIFLSKFSDSKQKADWFNLLGRSALALGEQEQSRFYFSRLIEEAPGSSYVGEVLLLRANRSERLYRFQESAENYIRYLKWFAANGGEEKRSLDSVRKKSLQFAWLADNPEVLRKVLGEKWVCTKKLESECNLYGALSYLRKPSLRSKEPYHLASKHRRHRNRAIWAFVALSNSASLGHQDKMDWAQIYLKNWNQVDSNLKLFLIPRLHHQISGILRSARQEIASSYPVKPNERSIARRVASIQRVEGFSSKLDSIPLQGVRVIALNEISNLYSDLSIELEKVQPLESLGEAELKVFKETMSQVAESFRERGKRIRERAFLLASSTNVGRETFKGIAIPYFSENPREAKRIIPGGVFSSRDGLDNAFLEGIGAAFESRSTELKTATKKAQFKEFRRRWIQALNGGNLPQMTYFVANAKAQGLLEREALEMMKGASLAKAGANAEAILVFEKLYRELNSEPKSKERSRVAVSLLKQYLATLSIEKVKTILDEMGEELVDEVELSEQEVRTVSLWRKGV